MNCGSGISYKIALRWMPQDVTDDKSILVQVMAWCRQATGDYLSQCWPRYLSPHGVTRPQWILNSCDILFKMWGFFSNWLYHKTSISVWNWSSAMIIQSGLGIFRTWCFSRFEIFPSRGLSRNVRKIHRRKYGHMAKPIAVFPNSVDNSWFDKCACRGQL